MGNLQSIGEDLRASVRVERAAVENWSRFTGGHADTAQAQDALLAAIEAYGYLSADPPPWMTSGKPGVAAYLLLPDLVSLTMTAYEGDGQWAWRATNAVAPRRGRGKQQALVAPPRAAKFTPEQVREMLSWDSAAISERVWLSKHAIDRIRERVHAIHPTDCGGQTVEESVVIIRAEAAHGCVQQPPPAWADGAGKGMPVVLYRHEDDEVALVLAPDIRRGDGYAAATTAVGRKWAYADLEYLSGEDLNRAVHVSSSALASLALAGEAADITAARIAAAVVEHAEAKFTPLGPTLTVGGATLPLRPASGQQRSAGITWVAHVATTGESGVSDMAMPSGLGTPRANLPGVAEAALAVADAIRCGKRIAVFCDYDPDGTCAGESMRLALSGVAPSQVMFGYARADRGFGLDAEFVTEASAWGADMLITVDCGSASVQQVKIAQGLGLRVLVCDHHKPSGDTTADWHCNPWLWGRSNLSGSVLAWLLALEIASHFETFDDDHLLWTRGLWCASFGARSDWMDPDPQLNTLAEIAAGLPAPPGVLALCDALALSSWNEEFHRLDDILNLPKRTVAARASAATQIWAADAPGEAAAAIEHLLGVERRSSLELRQMRMQAEGHSQRYGRVMACDIATPDTMLFTGHAGTLAHELNEVSGLPALAFLDAGEDADGRALLRWAARHNAGPNNHHSFTDQLPQIRSASLIYDGIGGLIPSAGGHPKAVSGRCLADRRDLVIGAFEAWADAIDDWVEVA